MKEIQEIRELIRFYTDKVNLYDHVYSRECEGCYRATGVEIENEITQKAEKALAKLDAMEKRLNVESNLDDQRRIELERFSGCCDAIKKHGVNATIIFPLRSTHEILQDRTHNRNSATSIADRRQIAAEWIAKNGCKILSNVLDEAQHIVFQELQKRKTSSNQCDKR
jgi:hypothetical protein